LLTYLSSQFPYPLPFENIFSGLNLFGGQGVGQQQMPQMPQMSQMPQMPQQQGQQGGQSFSLFKSGTFGRATYNDKSLGAPASGCVAQTAYM
jgi:hypothetical protein